MGRRIWSKVSRICTTSAVTKLMPNSNASSYSDDQMRRAIGALCVESEAAVVGNVAEAVVDAVLGDLLGFIWDGL